MMLLEVSYLNVKLSLAFKGLLSSIISFFFTNHIMSSSYSLLFLSVLFFVFCSQSHVSCLSRVDSHRSME